VGRQYAQKKRWHGGCRGVTGRAAVASTAMPHATDDTRAAGSGVGDGGSDSTHAEAAVPTWAAQHTHVARQSRRGVAQQSRSPQSHSLDRDRHTRDAPRGRTSVRTPARRRRTGRQSRAFLQARRRLVVPVVTARCRCDAGAATSAAPIVHSQRVQRDALRHTRVHGGSRRGTSTSGRTHAHVARQTHTEGDTDTTRHAQMTETHARAHRHTRTHTDTHRHTDSRTAQIQRHGER
jgi:hypothetical protein